MLEALDRTNDLGRYGRALLAALATFGAVLLLLLVGVALLGPPPT